MTLTKADLAKAVYLGCQDMTKADATLAVEALLRIAKDSMIGGFSLLLSGFGKFSVRDKNGRRGRNPQTGESLLLSPRRVVTFSASRSLRDRVNEIESK